MTFSDPRAKTKASADEATAQARLWSAGTFQALIAILGDTRTQRLLSDYADFLGEAEAAVTASRAEPGMVGKTMHDLHSTSGMLGFDALSEFCRDHMADGEPPSAATIEHLLGLISRSLQAARWYLAAAKLAA